MYYRTRWSHLGDSIIIERFNEEGDWVFYDSCGSQAEADRLIEVLVERDKVEAQLEKIEARLAAIEERLGIIP